jgi:NAD(P)-dependent dehydrogenase (short-subunit alcohol dehydrogenase family)
MAIDDDTLSPAAAPAPDGVVAVSPAVSPAELAAALAVLAKVAADRAVLASASADERARLQQLCGEVARPDLKSRKKLQKALQKAEHEQKKNADDDRRQQTGIRQLRAQPVFLTPPLVLPGAADIDDAAADNDDDRDTDTNDGGLHRARICYVCKQPYERLHHFYDQLCPACGDVSFAKRSPRQDLRGRVALVTGARVKIGYHAAILLLRNGCDVVVTTRFPKDAAARFGSEVDFADWGKRLSIWGLDLRHTPSVDALARHLLTTLPRLDFIIHNACQTVRRPPGFYGHLLTAEQAPLQSLPAAQQVTLSSWEAFAAAGHAQPALAGVAGSALLSQIDIDGHTAALPATSPTSTTSTTSEALASIFPAGALDKDLQQVDLRTHNSWRTTMGDVPVVELLEVLLVNAAAPFVLTSKLLPLMKRDNAGRDRHVVNVSAMEGQFYRKKKTDKHPHTNMAKAALNMLTRTSAMELAPHGIWMNAVDTGWVTDEDPAHLAARKVEEHRFSPPLDIVDGAARIVDPIFAGLAAGQHAHGVFFKDYQPAPW